MKDAYRDTAELLLDIAPRIFAEPEFAMKGGTAINLFVQPLPRLSVDIDLVFIPTDLQREEALQRISGALNRIRGTLERTPGMSARLSGADGDEVKLFVTRNDVRIKVEVNTVFRGTVYPTIRSGLSPAATEYFKRQVSVELLDRDELYASKLVAAMDRQHPRDLFDVMLLLDQGGITPRMRRAFVAYVAGHNRPIGELLTPNPQPLEVVYESDFVGMTTNDVPLADLLAARAQLFEELPRMLDDDERAFLLSLKRGEPNWDLLGIAEIARLPALQWKLQNVRRLIKSNPTKHKKLLTKLQEKLAH